MPKKKQPDHVSVTLGGVTFCIGQTPDNQVFLAWPGARIQLAPADMGMLTLYLQEASRIVALEARADQERWARRAARKASRS